jgi:hypothetical protein
MLLVWGEVRTLIGGLLPYSFKCTCAKSFQKGVLNAIPASLAYARLLSEEHINLRISLARQKIRSTQLHGSEFAACMCKRFH